MEKVGIRGRYRITKIEGEIVGVRKVDRGRVQIPKEVREALGISDGDSVYWVYGLDGRFYIVKATRLE